MTFLQNIAFMVVTILNFELNVKLTMAHDLPVYLQKQSTPVHLKDEILVELALMQFYRIITLLSNYKHSGPKFEQKKPLERLRSLIDSRRLNHRLRNDYSDGKFLLPNMTDAVHQFAGKTLFTTLDCSQVYQCVQMDDTLSVQLLSFDFSSRRYVYTRLAQGLSKSMTGFRSIVRSYLDSCLAANLCTQIMEDFGCGVETFEPMIPTLRQIFVCLTRPRRPLAPHECEFGLISLKFLGNTITLKGLKQETDKVEGILKTKKRPSTVRQVKLLVRFVLIFRYLLPNLEQVLMPCYKLLRKNVEYELEFDHLKNSDTIKKDLLKATKTTLRVGKQRQKYVILCDASYYSSGFVSMIEDYLLEKDRKRKQACAPVSFESHLFNTCQLKKLKYCGESPGHSSHFILGGRKTCNSFDRQQKPNEFFPIKITPTVTLELNGPNHSV